jgi:hypothetical protein
MVLSGRAPRNASAIDEIRGDIKIPLITSASPPSPPALIGSSVAVRYAILDYKTGQPLTGCACGSPAAAHAGGRHPARGGLRISMSVTGEPAV